MRKLPVVAALVVGAVLTGLTGVPSVARDADRAGTADAIEIGHIPKCIEAVPAAVGLPGDRVGLEVSVLLDGVEADRGAEVMGVAARSYAPLGIQLRSSFQSVSFSGTEVVGLMRQAKAFFGGARPSGSDVVLVLTAKNIEDAGNDSVAGMADCIGGVAFPDRAFAVSEVAPRDGFRIGPLVLDYELSAKVAAHEIGHLMGAHHHYANCVEGVASELEAGEFSPCTLMFNAVNPSSLNFSTVNGPIVRGHAELYAAP